MAGEVSCCPIRAIVEFVDSLDDARFGAVTNVWFVIDYARYSLDGHACAIGDIKYVSSTHGHRTNLIVFIFYRILR